MATTPRVIDSTSSRCRGIEVRELLRVPTELGLAHRFGTLPETGDQWRRLEGGRFEREPFDLVGDDPADALDLGVALLAATLGPGAEVVEVEHHEAGSAVHLGRDVARDGDVDEQERAAGAAGHHVDDQRRCDQRCAGPGARDRHIGVGEHGGQLVEARRRGPRCAAPAPRHAPACG